ncbi:MAG: transposase [Patescibacteria group bacterium]|nr:transposase [Patescibacteria group bacterium]
MPGRLVPLVTNEIYHVFNRGINRRPTFTNKREYQRATDSIGFYRFTNPPLSLSRFLRLELEKRKETLHILESRDLLIEILSYCLMPNHFHFLLKQKRNNGIAKFLSNFQNSYTRYFNTRHEGDGSLFLDQFKAVRIETDEQFLHVSRYIHLNPYTNYLLNSLTKLEKYPWSSFSSYINKSVMFVETALLLSFFRSPNEYKRFVFDQADYQRRLKDIEHLIFD